MATKTFISYNFNDREIAHSVRSMFQNNGGPINGHCVFVSGSSTPSYEIDNNINATMSGCDAALFIVGDNNHNSPWINREAELAISKNLPIVITQLPGTYGGTPHALAGNGVYANFSGSAIAQELNRY